MYPEFLNAEDLCMELGACAQKSLVALPTCDECTGSVAAIGELIKAEENVMDVIAFLQVKMIHQKTKIKSFKMYPTKEKRRISLVHKLRSTTIQYK